MINDVATRCLRVIYKKLSSYVLVLLWIQRSLSKQLYAIYKQRLALNFVYTLTLGFRNRNLDLSLEQYLHGCVSMRTPCQLQYACINQIGIATSSISDQLTSNRTVAYVAYVAYDGFGMNNRNISKVLQFSAEVKLGFSVIALLIDKFYNIAHFQLITVLLIMRTLIA